MKAHRRRNYLVKKTLQIRYALYIFITLCLTVLAASACVSFGLWDQIENEFTSARIRNRLQIATQIAEYGAARTQQASNSLKKLADFDDVEILSAREKEILVESLKKHNIELAIKAVALFFIIAIGTIFLTHKIAGPLYRFQKTFDEINKGDLKQRVYLRKDDHARDILPHLNAMLSSLDYSFAKIKVLKRKIFEEIDSGTLSPENLEHYKNELDSELNRYHTSDAFKI